ncbi:MAG: DUF1800 domain-containing protein [Caldilineaceae bacterium]
MKKLTTSENELRSSHSPAEQDDSLPSSHPRRQFLQGVGTLATASIVAALVAHPVEAQEPSSTTPAMRSPHNTLVNAAAAQVAAPPLAVLALNRMGFGPRPGDVAALLALADNPIASFEAYVEQQLNPAAIDDSACDAKIASFNFTTLAKSRSQLWTDHVKNSKTWEERTMPVRETERATFVKAIYSKRQLNELLADFWHNHFNVYGWDYWTAPVFVHYDRDVIRANMWGNFHTLLDAVAQSTAMIYYLDNASNTSAGPNENYARELFELHTMGAENYMGVVQDRSQVPVGGDGKPKLYIDKDVYQATQCFTGWRVNETTGEFTFEESVHAKYEKIVLNTPIGDFQGIRDGQIVLELLANHYGTATYICRKLCRRLIGDTPSDAIVKQAADVFYTQRGAADQLKQVVRTILLSDEFKTTWAQKIKRPFEFAVSMLRATNADFDAVNDHFYWQYDDAGQPLFQWHPPNGYPDFKESWATTMPMLQRWRTVNWLLNWTIGGDGANKDDLRINLFNQMPANVTTPPALVDYWSNRLLGYPLPADERQSVIEFMAFGRNPDYELPAEQIQDRLYSMIGLILMTPSFLWR